MEKYGGVGINKRLKPCTCGIALELGKVVLNFGDSIELRERDLYLALTRSIISQLNSIESPSFSTTFPSSSAMPHVHGLRRLSSPADPLCIPSREGYG